MSPENVGVKLTLLAALNPPAVTVTGANKAPAGTVTEREFELAEIIAALTPPKWTRLLTASGEKLKPEMVRFVPGTPTNGEIALTNGTPGCGASTVNAATELTAVPSALLTTTV